MPSYIYTSYNDTVNPVKCYAIIEAIVDNQPPIKSTIELPLNNFHPHGDDLYFVSYNPSKPPLQRCCVYRTSQTQGPNGEKIITYDERRPFFCGVKKEI